VGHGNDDQDHKLGAILGSIEGKPNSVSSNRVARLPLACQPSRRQDHPRAWRYPMVITVLGKVAVCTWTQEPIRR
jgi:hypothetical protein